MKPADRSQRCRNCLWFDRHVTFTIEINGHEQTVTRPESRGPLNPEGDHTTGICRRFPAQRQHDCDAQPTVDKYDWCGEWKYNGEPEPEPEPKPDACEEFIRAHQKAHGGYVHVGGRQYTPAEIEHVWPVVEAAIRKGGAE